MTRQGGWLPSGFGRRLQELRVARGLSQQQIGDRAGCHPITISKLERGTQEPAWPLVLALANALGVSTEDFRLPPGATPTPEPGRRGRPKKAGPPVEPEQDPPRKRGRPRKGG